MTLLLGVAAALMIAFFLSVYRSTGKPIRTAAKSMGIGALGLAAINVSAPLTGLALGYNAFTIGCSLLLGLPGVVGMLCLRILWR